MTENNKQTIMAFVRLACTLVAAGAAMFGFAVDADALFVGAACIASAAAFIWSWWKNNNVTAAATEAQEILEIAKNCEERRADEDEWTQEGDDEAVE